MCVECQIIKPKKKTKPTTKTEPPQPPQPPHSSSTTSGEKWTEIIIWSIFHVLTPHFPYRHKRTHDRGDGADGGLNLSGEDEEEYSGEDQLGSLEEASPTSEGGYVTASLNTIANGPPPTTNPMTSASAAITNGPTFNSLQTLSMPMTISQPQPINAGGMM